jgi:methylenetetrahydrofolate dehydrogenase (NADP+)/methenyltetrahydrofolate cyclohydrolase/formyltetrahydrofolate synthetase
VVCLPSPAPESSPIPALISTFSLPFPFHLPPSQIASQGCIELLKRYRIPIEGRRAVVLGRSNIVGVPAATLLQQENATVTICHSRTPDIPAIIGEADILIAAIGKPLFVKGEWLKPGAVVIDVGINSVPDATKKTG